MTKKGRYFKKKAAQNVKKVKQESESILILRSWNKRLLAFLEMIKNFRKDGIKI